MKAKRQRVKLTKAEQEAFDRQIKEELLRLNAEYEHLFDVILAYVMNEYEGYGAMRFERLYNHLIDARLELRRRYSDDAHSDDTVDIFAMELKLKEKKGIDVKAILDKIMRERRDDINELNGGKAYEE